MCITQPIVQITTDTQKNIWIAVESQGVFLFDNDRQTLTHYAIPDAHLLSSICIDQQNAVWIGYNGKGLYYTDDHFQNFRLFQTQEGKNLFTDDQIFKIFPEQHNTLYTGSAKGGLKSINILTRTVTDLLPDSSQTESIFVRNIYPIDKKTLWVATERGIYTYNKETREIQHLTYNPNDDYSLSDNAIYSLYKDAEGGIWIGSYFGGIDYYPTQYATFEKYYPIIGQNSLSGKVVREFCEDEDGNLWIGTEDGGLNKFNPKTKEFSPCPLAGLHYNVHALSMDNHTLWIGTYSKGLYSLDLKTHRSRHYLMGHAENTLNDNNIYSMCRTSAGQLYIGTTTVLNLYNHETNDFTRIHKMDGIFVFNILEDSKGNIWFATYNSGIFKYNPRNNSWKNYVSTPGVPHGLPYNKVISIYEDSKQRLWFTMLGRGFCSFNQDTEEFTTYDSSQGLANDVIYKIVEANNDILWLTSNKGLIRFDLKTKTSNIYADNNGLLTNQFNYSSGIKSKDGTIYFGCINGFIAFKPESFTENTYFPPVAITDFLLFNKSADIGTKDSPLSQSVTYTREINLKYNQNSFAFRFAALCYAAPEENYLSYTLKGFDKEWYNVGRNSVINYSNLPYGTYIFHLRGSNSDGKWNEKERILKIHILPPFYLSGWAYFIYLLLGILSVVGIIYYFRKRNEQKHQQAMEKFEREKERELYTAKIDFFTNVAHEIRTPLTLIKSPLENVLVSPNVSADIRDDLEIMNLNTTRLLDLVNQLLDFRKTETRGFQLNFVECNISDILQQIYMRFTPLARQKKLEFVIECSESIYASIDREALTKIISNLFTNAIKYSETYIHVRLWMEDTCWFLSVCNDGNVIPMEMREEIFKPFIQYKDGFSRKVSGTGIGLALARSLAELHEGNLIMDDSQKQNCFILSLPVKHEHTIAISKSEVKLKEDPKEEDPRQLQQKPRYTVLIVEDNVEMLAFVVRQLSPVYQILTATNGVEALKVLEGHTVNLIVSDIMMPEMDGLELCDRIKSDLDYSHIPIVLLTAKTTLQSKIDGLKSGADAYIEKPFSVEYLKVSVANLLSNHEKLHAAFAHSPFIQTNSMAMTKADETFLKTLNEVIVANMQNPDFCLDDMASLLNMSRSSLNRKIKGVLDMTPNDYIRLERLKKAAQLLREGECKVNEVCYMVGFNTPSYFTKCFQKQFGILPKDFVK